MNKTKHSIEEMHDKLNTDEQLQLIVDNYMGGTTIEMTVTTQVEKPADFISFPYNVPVPEYAKYPTLPPKEKAMGPGDIDEEDPNHEDLGYEDEGDFDEDIYDDEPDNTGADDGEDD